MTTLCTLSKRDARDVTVWKTVTSILARSNALAGTPLVSDQALVDARQGTRQTFLISLNAALASDSGADADADADVDAQGFALLGSGELDLIVDPRWRNHGLGSCALTTLLRDVVDRKSVLRVWVHGDEPAARTILSAQSFAAERELLKLACDLTVLERGKNRGLELPDGYEISSFQPDDAREWLTLNRKVFADHPEQSAITATDLSARIREPWFNPHDFLLLRHNRELVGFCWLKVTTTESVPDEVNDRATDGVTDGVTEGEIYVIGVNPDHAGQGLGALLLDRGLERLRECGVDRVSLYVEADNAPAMRLYSSRGFTVAQRSTQWVRSAA